jgi:hypothetical protein
MLLGMKLGWDMAASRSIRSIPPTLFLTTAMGAAITIKDVAVDVDLVVFVGCPTRIQARR